ncbi:MAG: hypothetical protein ABJA50_06925 [Chloroflexota bacterium]
MKLRNRIGLFCLLVVALGAICAALLLQPNRAQQAKADTLPPDTLPPTPVASPTQSTDPNDFTTEGPFPFAPFTIADFGPITTNADMSGSLVVNGDWVAYTSSNIVCGHCGNIARSLFGQNIVTGKLVTIRGSSAKFPDPASDSRVGISKVELHDSTVTWVQPSRPSPPATPDTTDFQAGDYDCAKCFYDLETGEHGEVVGDRQPPVIPPAWSVESSPYDPNNLAEHAITVTQQPTGTLAFRTTFKNYWGAYDFAFDSNKMVFVESMSTYGTAQLVRVAWLLPPNAAFTDVWTKADGPVAAGTVARSWLWGPGPSVTRYEQYEQYEQGPGQQRLVQYYDKSRMEINNPNADPKSPGYITNGLLTVEMIGGEIQTGDANSVEANSVEAKVQADIPVVGDPRKDNPLAPSYADLQGVATIHGEHQAAVRTGQQVDDAIAVQGIVSKDTAHAGLASYAAYSDETKHNVPDVFWKYLTEMNANYGFDWTFVLGYPITEAYWTQMRVGGKDMPVLIQAYQRRVLTYVPDFEPTWQVQQGNVGQHYLEWITSNRMNRMNRMNRLNRLLNPDIIP